MAVSTNSRNRKRFKGPRRRFRVLTAMYLRNEVLTNAIIEEATGYNWELIDMRFFGEDEAGKQDLHADGFLSCRHTELELFRSRAPHGVCVGYSAWYKPEESVCVIEPDHEEVGRLAAEHFVERGFRHTSCVNIPVGVDHPPHPTVSVGVGFERCLAAAGVHCHAPLMLTDRGYRSGRDQFAAWLQRVPRPVGLLVWQDRSAALICGWCRDLGVLVPEEVAVMGIGNKRSLCKLSPCPLSSVDTDSATQGRKAVRLLQRMMQGDAVEPGAVRIAPTGVVTRKSTDILAVADVHVATALRFLWEHIAEPISVDDVASVGGVSRSTLERHFRQQIGRSVNQELLRKRLARCRELLLTTELPITDIAPRAGFFTRGYLHRAFAQHFGMSPSQYRRRQTA